MASSAALATNSSPARFAISSTAPRRSASVGFSEALDAQLFDLLAQLVALASHRGKRPGGVGEQAARRIDVVAAKRARQLGIANLRWTKWLRHLADSALCRVVRPPPFDQAERAQGA